ncbi:uncharacterized protein LOC141619477 [Silene latifolia]|uniref:uncharacterized protein LOC141619477 n=1 Tax=Silene latifolia TaxID=37657 RepID=UPI003D783A70
MGGFDIRLEEGISMAITEVKDDLYSQVNEEVCKFSSAGAVFWRQQAKVKWIVDGDTVGAWMVLREMNHTFISLIPNNDSPEDVSDYRPISLFNVLMRVVTKCITNRLGHVMGSLVGEFQNAFIPGRHISDNVLLAHEAIHNINSHRKGKEGRFAFKDYMSKAYNRVRWNFLHMVLYKFGFLDDSIFFLHDNDESISHLKKLIDEYCEVSGQVLIEGKSGILFSPGMTLRKSKKEVIRDLVKHVTRRISSWNGVFYDRLRKTTNWCYKNFLSLPKSEGGLGIRNIKCLNQALLAKHAWKMISGKDSYFCTMFRRKMIQKTDHGFVVRRRSISELGVWETPWINGKTPEPRETILTHTFGFLKDLKIKDLKLVNGGWNKDMIKFLFPDEFGNQILAMPCCISQSEDTVFWKNTSDRLYMMWKILIWKIITDTLSVGSGFARRRILGDYTFCLCSSDDDNALETTEHLLRDCPITRRISACFSLGINVNQNGNIGIGDWVVNWIKYLGILEEGGNRTMNIAQKAMDGNKKSLVSGSLVSHDCEGGSNTWFKDGHPLYVIRERRHCRPLRVKVDVGWLRNYDASVGWVVYGNNGLVVAERRVKISAESAL